MDIIKELKKDGMLLRKIPKKEQTTEICKTAIKQNPLALQFVSRKCLDSKMCLAAVKKDGYALRHVPSQFVTKKMCELAVEAAPELLNNVPENFRTSMICINAVKKDVNTLLYISQEKRYELFDDNTEIDLIEKIVAHNPKWLVYMPNRPDVRALCINYMNEDFSIAQYMPEQIKISEDILNYQKSKGKLQFTHKYYDSEEKRFNVKIKVVCGQCKSSFDENEMIEESYCVLEKFEGFDKFYDFLDGNLFDAELRDYSFQGIDLKKYNIEGATINSEILQLQGLYDGTYFATIKKVLEINSNEITGNNEIMIPNEFSYPKPVDDDGHERFDISHIPFFYISDIHLVHRVCNQFKDKATKEEIRSYIKFLARSMVSSIGTRPFNSYLLIAGDTSSIFEFAAIFYNELIQWWNPNQIVVVSGNHELWDPCVDMEKNLEIYRKFFDNLGIKFLQNDLMCVEDRRKCDIFSEVEILKMSEEEIRNKTQRSSIIILGGIGFSGLNEKFNASNIPYGKSFDELSREEAWQKDIQEANRFNTIYTKILEKLGKSRVIVLTHVKKGDWNAETHNPHWIYLNGHNHRNFYEVNDRRTIYADNQIGYRAKNIGLKYFYCANDYDIFAYYQDGIHEITREQYIDFNRGKLVSMSFNREDGTIYMLKRNSVYLFLMYCEYSKRSGRKSLYLMNGGILERLGRNRLEDLSYYYDSLEKYVKNVNQLLNRYVGAQQKLSEFIKHLGGSGKIHGCIVDVERPKELEGFSYCHLFVNPIDGKVTPYFAYDVKSRIVYKDFKTLLQAHDSCKLMANNYLRLEKETAHNLPIVQYSGQMEEWENEDSMYDEGSYLYRISRIIKSLQYCTEKKIVRLWNEELLNYDFVNWIKQSNQIDEIVDDRLMIDEKSV
ncbi:MAG: DUF4116 domain-containing protein [Lachnospiraceae bacterium]|nr:DUF4116 domain-containing protein [Lachnospiraceae bacterium]